MRQFVWCFLAMSALASAEQLPPPVQFFSTGYSGRYYVGDMEHFVTLGYAPRLAPRWGAEVQLAGAPRILGLEASVTGIRYFSARIRSKGYEDWVGISTGIQGSEAVTCIDCKDWATTPVVSLLYGSNRMPQPRSFFGYRFAMRLGAAMPRAFGREDSMLGIEHTGHIFLAIEVGVLWF